MKVRSVSCNVGFDQLFVQLSRSGMVRWHLQRDWSVKMTSRELSVYHTTSCCFLLCFLLSTSIRRRQKTFCPKVPVACQNIVPLIHSEADRILCFLEPLINLVLRHISSWYLKIITISFICFPFLCAIYIWVIYARKEDVCAAFFSSK